MKTAPRRRRAMTLVEIMIALVLFGISTGSLLSMTTMMHRTAISNVADSVALQAAEGIMEQIRAMPYDDVLQKAATAPAGTTTLPLNRFQPARADGSSATLDSQQVPVNSPTPVALENVDLATAVNANYAVASSVRLPMDVQLLVREIKDANFAQGITVEIVYSFKYRVTDDRPATHVLKTFIARSVT